MKKVLITGGAGFIGSNLAKRLIESGGYEIHAFDNLHPQVHRQPGRPDLLPDRVILHTGDVSLSSNWDTVLKLVQPEIIVHLAAETGTGQSLTESSRHGMVNVVGTTSMLDALNRNKIKPEHIILASSRAVYGDGLWQSTDGSTFYAGNRSHEMLENKQWDYNGKDGQTAKALPSRADTTEPRPTNIYAATKLAQEHICRAWTTAFSVPFTVLRFQNVYGPGQSLENSYTGIVALFSRLSNEGKPIDVYEDGQIIRDFVYVDDVAQSLEKSILSPPKVAEERALDIGCGVPCTVLEVAQKLSQLASAPEPQISGKFRDGDVRAASCDITLSTQTIGYTPEWPLERGLKSLLDWVSETNNQVG
ncbi:MAG: NAD-dependent epimerase/dehydratase family protein [Patescibacteria group bacterium]